jgi:hypothetical protein
MEPTIESVIPKQLPFNELAKISVAKLSELIDFMFVWMYR